MALLSSIQTFLAPLPLPGQVAARLDLVPELAEQLSELKLVFGKSSLEGKTTQAGDILRKLPWSQGALHKMCQSLPAGAECIRHATARWQAQVEIGASLKRLENLGALLKHGGSIFMSNLAAFDQDASCKQALPRVTANTANSSHEQQHVL